MMIFAQQRPRGVRTHDAPNDGDNLSLLSLPLLGFCAQVLWVFLFLARQNVGRLQGPDTARIHKVAGDTPAC